MSGSARARVVGVLRGAELDARVDGRVAGLHVKTSRGGPTSPGASSDLNLGQGTISGLISGPLGAPRLEASLTGTDLHAAGYHFDRITARASGPALAPRLDAELVDDAEGFIRASGQLDARGAAVRGVKVTVSRKDTVVAGEIARIGARDGGVAIEGVKLEGESVGSAEASLMFKDGDISGKLKGNGVDLARIAILFGIPQRVRGIANVDISLERRKTGREGYVRLELEGGEISLFSGVSAQLTANFKGDEVTADGLVRLVAIPTHAESDEELCDGTIAQVRVSRGAGVLPGPLLSASTWEHASGDVQIAAEDWDLRCLAKLVPIGLPLGEITGKVTTRFAVSRAPSDRFPSIKDVFFRTRGLAIAGLTPRDAEAPEWESRGIDLQLKGELDGRSGKTRGQLTLFDGLILADLTVGVDLDLPALFHDGRGSPPPAPSAGGSAGSVPAAKAPAGATSLGEGHWPELRWATLKNSGLSGGFAVPRRPVGSFRTLPSFLAKYVPPLAGDIRADGFLSGTLDRPFASARVFGWGIAAIKDTGARGKLGDEAAPAGDWALPIDVVAMLTYDSRKATLTAHATRGNLGIASASADIEADLHALLAERVEGEKAPWTGSFHVQLSELPLGDLPFLADHGVAGHVKGTATMSQINQEPTLELNLDLPDLQIGSELFFQQSNLSLNIGPTSGAHGAVARATLEQFDGGRLDASAFAGIVWQDGIIPTLDPARPANLEAKAKELRLAALHPLVSSIFSKLDGVANGKLSFGWDGVAAGSGGDRVGEDGRAEVDLRVTEGEFHIPQLGQELRNARVRIITKPGATLSSTTVFLDDVAAQAASGEITGHASGSLDGLRFVGGQGEFEIKRGAEMPITFEGVPLGNARGRITLEAKKHEDEIAMTIRLRSLHLDLPASSGRNVQALDDHAEITVSHPIGIEKEPRAADALRWVLTFDVPRAHIEGSGIDVKLSGTKERPPRVELSDQVHLTGDILIEEGQFERFGKIFVIEPMDRPGLVRLRAEDAANPYLNVRAHWDAPDGSRIYVDYIGVLKPITHEKLRFTSSDGRPPDQIFQILLFGTDAAEGAARPGEERAGGVAVGLGGGLASEQFNALLSGIAPLRGLSTRIGTSDDGALKTTVGYQIAGTVSASASFESAPSQSGGSSSSNIDQRTGGAQLNVDWRFHPRWSVSTKLGVRNQQTNVGADLLWQYRY